MTLNTSLEQKKASVERQLDEANHALRNIHKYALSLYQRGGKLYARGNFPPKTNSAQTKPYRQAIALDCNATTQGIKEAMTKTIRFGDALRNENFNWLNFFEEDQPKEKAVGVWWIRLLGQKWV